MKSGQSWPPCVVSRPFQGEGDFWRVRNLLLDTYSITPTDWNWEMRRWDGQRFHNASTEIDPAWAAKIRLWETADGLLVGAVHPEDGGDAWPEIHPDYRFIEPEMIAWAEGHLFKMLEDGRRQLDVVVFAYDVSRQYLLAARGYAKTPYCQVSRRLRLGNRPVVVPPTPAGYAVRGTRPDDPGEAQRTADILNAGFGRTVHQAIHSAMFFANAPSFRHDLHLVAEAADGSFAALAALNYDPINRRGIFEPVCTHPDHRCKGLARLLMLEGMRRIKALGATDVYVGTGRAVAANRLYDAVGFTEVYRAYVWRKVY